MINISVSSSSRKHCSKECRKGYFEVLITKIITPRQDTRVEGTTKVKETPKDQSLASIPITQVTSFVSRKAFFP